MQTARATSIVSDHPMCVQLGRSIRIPRTERAAFILRRASRYPRTSHCSTPGTYLIGRFAPRIASRRCTTAIPLHSMVRTGSDCNCELEARAARLYTSAGQCSMMVLSIIFPSCRSQFQNPETTFEVCDALQIPTGTRTHGTEHLVAFRQQKLRQIRPVLSIYPRDQCGRLVSVCFPSQAIGRLRRLPSS